jgi:hypothetical protein
MNMDSGDRPGAAVPEIKQPAVVDIRHMTAEQFGALGMSHIAYVKPVMMNGQQGFAIHAADGTPMAIAGDREVAVAVILQHEMHALSVH